MTTDTASSVSASRKRVPAAPAWSSADVTGTLLRAGAGWRDRAWIASYLLGRRGPRAFRRLLDQRTPAEAALALRELDAPLHLSVETGGLATYYEIVIQRIYAPSLDFEPAAGQTVVDVGANIGVFSLWAASKIGPTGRLLSVEPHPLSYHFLEQNVRPFAFATATRTACGDHAGELDLHFVPGRLSVASALPRPDRTGLVRVPLSRLDELVARANIDTIDLLKIDVEGVEREVVEGAGDVLSRVTRLVMEVDADGIAWVERTLSGFGLRLVSRRTGTWHVPAGAGGIAAFERS